MQHRYTNCAIWLFAVTKTLKQNWTFYTNSTFGLINKRFDNMKHWSWPMAVINIKQLEATHRRKKTKIFVITWKHIKVRNEENRKRTGMDRRHHHSTCTSHAAQLDPKMGREGEDDHGRTGNQQLARTSRTMKWHGKKQNYAVNYMYQKAWRSCITRHAGSTGRTKV